MVVDVISEVLSFFNLFIVGYYCCLVVEGLLIFELIYLIGLDEMGFDIVL